MNGTEGVDGFDTSGDGESGGDSEGLGPQLHSGSSLGSRASPLPDQPYIAGTFEGIGPSVPPYVIGRGSVELAPVTGGSQLGSPGVGFGHQGSESHSGGFEGAAPELSPIHPGSDCSEGGIVAGDAAGNQARLPGMVQSGPRASVMRPRQFGPPHRHTILRPWRSCSPTLPWNQYSLTLCLISRGEVPELLQNSI